MDNKFYIEPANPLKALMVGEAAFDRSRKQAEDNEAKALYAELGKQVQGGGIGADAIGRALALGPKGAPLVAALGALAKGDTTDELKDYKFDMEQRKKLGQPEVPFGQWKTNLKQAGATRVNNAVNMGEGEYAKTVAKADGDRFNEFLKSGRGAFSTIGSLDRMGTLVEDPGFYSGTAGETVVLPFKQAISSMGGNPNAAAPMEEFRALSSKAALDGIGGSLGTGFSNADRDFITNQYPTLANTPEGNKARIEGLKKIEQRKIEIARKARSYAKANGGRLDAGFDDELATWAESNPVFTPKASGNRNGGTPPGAMPQPRLAPDGNSYIPDPNRPGKYLMVR